VAARKKLENIAQRGAQAAEKPTDKAITDNVEAIGLLLAKAKRFEKNTELWVAVVLRSMWRN
jgi:hypothetical protein